MVFFFFQSGVNTKVTRVLEHSVGACLLPFCNGAVERVEMASVLSLWFIPIWHFGYREVMLCRDCGFVTSPENYAKHHARGPALADAKAVRMCDKCGAPLAGRLWRYCPHCGSTVAPNPFSRTLPPAEEAPFTEATDVAQASSDDIADKK